MGIIAAFLLFVRGTLSAMMAKQLTDEFKAWNPWWVSYWIKTAVSRLPADQRERFAEEWQSDVSRIPGELGKIIMALGCIIAAYRIAAIHKESHETILDSLLLVFDTISPHIAMWLCVTIVLSVCGFFILLIIMCQWYDPGSVWEVDTWFYTVIKVCAIVAIPSTFYINRESVEQAGND